MGASDPDPGTEICIGNAFNVHRAGRRSQWLPRVRAEEQAVRMEKEHKRGGVESRARRAFQTTART